MFGTPFLYTVSGLVCVIVKAVSVDDMEAAGREAEKILNATISPKQTALKYKADDVLKRAAFPWKQIFRKLIIYNQNLAKSL